MTIEEIDELFAFKTVIYTLSDDALKVMLSYDAEPERLAILRAELARRSVDSEPCDA